MSFRGGWELGHGRPDRDREPNVTGAIGYAAAHIWPLAAIFLAGYGLVRLIWDLKP